MNHQIAALHLESLAAGFDAVGTDSKVLEGLSKINLFIGPNNSGKSRFLRQLAKITTPKFRPSQDLGVMREIRTDLKAGLTTAIQTPFSDIGGLKAEFETLPNFEWIIAGERPFWQLGKFLDKLAAINIQSNLVFGYSSGYMGGGPKNQALSSLNVLGNNVKLKFDANIGKLPQEWSFKRIYIPTLRGLRPFDSVGDVYRIRTQKDYFSDKDSPEIDTGLQLYKFVQSLLLGDLKQRRIVRDFERFLSETFFENQGVAIIPRMDSDVLYIKIGEEAEQPIFNLGDGIQMVIIIMLPLFISRGNSVLLFIEEPELYLHPGLQRTLLNAIGQFDHVQCFIATHSNHLLDLSTDRSDISIYAVRKDLEATEGDEKKAKCLVENLSNSDCRILNLLGVRNSSVFLSNCTIWVEGITDRRYIRRFLKIYTEEQGKSGGRVFKEDLHYSFVEYGGSNITHWSFLDKIDDPIVVERLCARLMLVADKDSSVAKDERHNELESKLGDRFIVLPRREIENLLLPETIRSVVADYEGSTDGIRQIRYRSYSNVYLGAFIEKNILGSPKKRKGSYQDKSGTISDKVAFCDKALDHIHSSDELSSDAVDLAARIYNFIAAHNLN